MTKKAKAEAKAPIEVHWRSDTPAKEVERGKEALHNWWRDAQKGGKPEPTIQVQAVPCD